MKYCSKQVLNLYIDLSAFRKKPRILTKEGGMKIYTCKRCGK